MKSLKSFLSWFEKVSNILYNVSVLNLNLVSLITESRANSSKNFYFWNRFSTKISGLSHFLVQDCQKSHHSSFLEAYSTVARFDQISFTFCPENRPLFSPIRARGVSWPPDPPLDPLLIVVVKVKVVGQMAVIIVTCPKVKKLSAWAETRQPKRLNGSEPNCRRIWTPITTKLTAEDCIRVKGLTALFRSLMSFSLRPTEYDIRTTQTHVIPVLRRRLLKNRRRPRINSRHRINRSSTDFTDIVQFQKKKIGRKS